MDRVEHEHDVERFVDREPSRVAHLEAHVGEAGTAGLGAGARDRALVEVVADERRRRERPRQQHERVAGAARDVGDARARLEPLGEPGTSGRYASISNAS